MKYAAKFATAQGKRLDMYGAHVKAVCESMQQRSGEQPMTGLQMKEQLETIAGTKAPSTEGQSGTRTQGQGSLRRRTAPREEENVPVSIPDRKRGTASRGRVAMEGTIGQGTVSGQERLSEIPEGTYEDQVSTKLRKQVPWKQARKRSKTYNQDIENAQ